MDRNVLIHWQNKWLDRTLITQLTDSIDAQQFVEDKKNSNTDSETYTKIGSLNSMAGLNQLVTQTVYKIRNRRFTLSAKLFGLKSPCHTPQSNDFLIL